MKVTDITKTPNIQTDLGQIHSQSQLIKIKKKQIILILG